MHTSACVHEKDTNTHSQRLGYKAITMQGSEASSDKEVGLTCIEAASENYVESGREQAASQSEIRSSNARRAPVFLQSLMQCRADCEATYEAVTREVELILANKNVDIGVERDKDTTLPVIYVLTIHAPLLIIYVESLYGHNGHGVTFFVGQGQAARNCAVNELQRYCKLHDFRVTVADVVAEWIKRFHAAFEKYGGEKCVKDGEMITTTKTCGFKEVGRNNKLTKSLSQDWQAGTLVKTDVSIRVVGDESQKQQEGRISGTVGGPQEKVIKQGTPSDDCSNEEVIVMRKSRKRTIKLQATDAFQESPRKQPRVTTQEVYVHRVDKSGRKEVRQSERNGYRVAPSCARDTGVQKGNQTMVLTQAGDRRCPRCSRDDTIPGNIKSSRSRAVMDDLDMAVRQSSHGVGGEVDKRQGWRYDRPRASQYIYSASRPYRVFSYISGRYWDDNFSACRCNHSGSQGEQKK